MHEIETRVWNYIKRISPVFGEKIFARRVTIKYLISGGIAFMIDTTALSVAKNVFHIQFDISVMIGFFFGLCASFTFQKFWTFENLSTDGLHKQMSLYVAVTAINFFLNSLLMHILFNYVHLAPVPAKILVTGSIAVASFFVYRRFIFIKK